MKKTLTKLLLLFICLTSVSCSPKEEKEITCSQVIEKYEELGYEIFHKEDVLIDDEYVCYIKVEDKESKDFIFFNFFTTKEAALEYEKENEYNFLVYLFTIVLGDATWIHTTTYNNIEIEYENKEMYKPFLELTK